MLSDHHPQGYSGHDGRQGERGPPGNKVCKCRHPIVKDCDMVLRSMNDVSAGIERPGWIQWTTWTAWAKGQPILCVEYSFLKDYSIE